MKQILVFTLIFLPIGGIIGLASATIGFTSWTIVVPLLYVGFGFDIFDSIFLSIVLDLVDATLLSVIYLCHRKVSLKHVAGLGPFAIVGAVGGLFLAKITIDNVTSLLKRGLGYALLVLGILFIIRGIFMWRQSRKERLLQTKPDPELLVNEQQHLASSPSIQDAESEEGLTESTPLQAPPATKTERFLVFLQIFGMVAIVTASGIVSGVFGFGSGLNFVLMLLLIARFELLQATGTACMLMGLVMLVCMVGYLAGSVPLHLGFLWPYLLIAMAISSVGVGLGSLLALKISPVPMNFVVAVVLFVVGLIAILQPIVINGNL